jgi:Uma2 family endonuclease
MAIVASADRYPRLREALRSLQPPFLLRHFDATPEDYETITDEDLKCEYIDGELIVHSPASFEHEELALFVGALLREFVSGRGLGRVVGSNAVMQLGQRRFSPDVSVLLAPNDGRIRQKRVMGPVDLAVEVISASTRAYDFETKLSAYREGRVGEIWLIDAERRQFVVHAWTGEDYVSRVLATGVWSSVAVSGLEIRIDCLWQDPLPGVRECIGTL